MHQHISDDDLPLDTLQSILFVLLLPLLMISLAVLTIIDFSLGIIIKLLPWLKRTIKKVIKLLP